MDSSKRGEADRRADCADVGITRTSNRSELLYPRSKLVTTAKAFGLQAIDLVSQSPTKTGRWLLMVETDRM